MIPIVTKLTVYAMYAGQRCRSWCLRSPFAVAWSTPTARISSVIAIAKTPSLNASARPVSTGKT